MKTGQTFDLSSEIIHVDNIRFEEDTVHENIISPFSRLYYIESGVSQVMIRGVKTELKAHNLYLIPGFTPCSYYFKKGMNHYFIHCIFSLKKSLNPFPYINILKEVKAIEIDFSLFKRIFQLHPDKRLPHYNPHVYHKTMWQHKDDYYKDIKLKWESEGIVQQLFSRFITQDSMQLIQGMSRYKIEDVLFYIKENLQEDIFITDLAQLCHLSPDHFTRVFKSIIGIGPKEYIIRERLQQAQLLLLTTDLNVNEILSLVNFKSAAYFSRIFKKYTLLSPLEYRKRRSLAT